MSTIQGTVLSSQDEPVAARYCQGCGAALGAVIRVVEACDTRCCNKHPSSEGMHYFCGHSCADAWIRGDIAAFKARHPRWDWSGITIMRIRDSARSLRTG